jgi:hypothetical protein
MADITMCDGANCSRKETCFRYRANPNPHRQSYFMEPPLDKSGECASYWPIKDASQFRRLNIKTKDL